MDKTIDSAHWYPDCVSFWIRADEARSRDEVTAALRRHVELVLLPRAGIIRRVEVAPPESWGGTGMGRVDVYYRDTGVRRPPVTTLGAAHEAAGGTDGVTPDVLLGWRASGWLRDEWGRATV